MINLGSIIVVICDLVFGDKNGGDDDSGGGDDDDDDDVCGGFVSTGRSSLLAMAGKFEILSFF